MALRRTSSPDAGEITNSGDRRVSVLLPLPLSEAYDYWLPGHLAAPPGSFVRVPLGRRELVGVVWGEGGGHVADEKLKDVRARLPAPPMTAPLRDFVDWVAGYTLTPPGAVLRMAMNVPEALEPPRPRTAYGKGSIEPERMTAARARVLAEIADGPPRPAAELARAAGVSPGVVRALADAGVLESVLLPPGALFETPDWRHPGPALSAAQRVAADDLAGKVGAARFGVTLLDGVNGAGKTEVYFAAIAGALERGRQALVLLPEIALGAQWLARFAARFGAAPAEWHSELTHARRRDTWRAVAEGAARVVVGARSALYLPFSELGVIVIDEEHDASFKQEDGVIYHARDMAVVRGRLEGVPVVLCSATPSLETVINVEAGRYDRLGLPDRHGRATLPTIEAVDMRDAPLAAGSWVSPVLSEALTETFEAGEQAMLFLNRRGYAPLTLCRACGFRMGCPNCTAWLVEHRHLGRLECHHCGYAARLPDDCPSCGAEDRFAACGPGVERLAEEIAALFPETRLAVMASDTVGGPAAAAELVRRVAAREIDLLIGTQIMAKGHHFPLLTLVGVVDADLGLAGGDLRAAERTYQLLHQVAGRAGRADHPGRVLVQTYMPEHPVMQALVDGDRDRFLGLEAADRCERGMPPFGRLAAVIVSGPSEDAVRRLARRLSRTAPQVVGVEVLGPAPAPLALLRGRYRYRLLMKTPRETHIQRLLREWLGGVSPRGGLRVQIDIDPYSFM